MASRDEIRWSPPVALNAAEQRICNLLKRNGRFFRFLRLHRHELLDDDFQAKLAAMYADDYGPGRPPVAPGLLVMATLLQAYTGASDADAIHHAIFDARWQMVLDCFGCEHLGKDGEGKAPFSLGLLVSFRARLIAADMDRELLRRTVELAKTTKDFGFKALRVALDSAPIWGVGRVEDTFNLLGHALRVAVTCASDFAGTDSVTVIREANLEVVGGSSVKGKLDIDWDDEGAKASALNLLLDDVAKLRAWVSAQPVPNREARKDEWDTLQAAMKQVDRIVAQDIEPDPDGGGSRIIDGTAADRQISVGDPEMRHGRKSKTKTIEGYKGHLGYALDENLILDALVVPANCTEHEGGDRMRPNIEHYGEVVELHADRGYLPSQWVEDLHKREVAIYTKPWAHGNRGLFPKAAFAIDLAAGTVHCPGGDVQAIPPVADKDGRKKVAFENCATCTVRAQCTTSERGRTVVLHANEDLLQRLKTLKETPEGRATLRERTRVEHRLAHVLVYQTHKARFVGARKNTFAFLRAAVVVNLQTLDGAPLA